jgi:hypothetical protein
MGFNDFGEAKVNASVKGSTDAQRVKAEKP